MKKYATFDAEGLPTAFYSEDIHGTTIPANAIEITENQWQEFIDNQSSRKWLNGQIVEHAPPQMPVDLPAYAAAKRWEREVSGTIWNGWPVLSDRESQSKIIAEAVAIEKGERVDGDPWKFADGEFRPLTNEQMDDLAAAVRLHVRNSYGIEAQVLAAIEAGSITTEAQINAAFA